MSTGSTLVFYQLALVKTMLGYGNMEDYLFNKLSIRTLPEDNGIFYKYTINMKLLMYSKVGQ